MAIDYAKLTKVQKVAAFLITVGPDNAGKMMKHFENAQLETICREITEMPVLEANVQREVLREFAGIIMDGLGSTFGGLAFAHSMLTNAKGEYTAAAILNRCATTTRSAEGDEIGQMEGRHLLNMVKTEQPQTVAFILSCMEAKKAAELLTMLPEAIREEVVERLGSMEATSHDSISKVAKNLNRHVDRGAPPMNLQLSGGVKACADVLNAVNKDVRKALMARVEERNAELGAAIRKVAFSFDDLGRLSPGDLQKVLREVDSASLPIALKGVKPELANVLLGAMSKRAAQAVREEIEQLGPQKAKDVDAAQQRVIQIVRKLEESEEITLDEGGGDNDTV